MLISIVWEFGSLECPHHFHIIIVTAINPMFGLHYRDCNIIYLYLIKLFIINYDLCYQHQVILQIGSRHRQVAHKWSWMPPYLGLRGPLCRLYCTREIPLDWHYCWLTRSDCWCRLTVDSQRRTEVGWIGWDWCLGWVLLNCGSWWCSSCAWPSVGPDAPSCWGTPSKTPSCQCSWRGGVAGSPPFHWPSRLSFCSSAACSAVADSHRGCAIPLVRSSASTPGSTICPVAMLCYSRHWFGAIRLSALVHARIRQSCLNIVLACCRTFFLAHLFKFRHLNLHFISFIDFISFIIINFISFIIVVACWLILVSDTKNNNWNIYQPIC